MSFRVPDHAVPGHLLRLIDRAGRLGLRAAAVVALFIITAAAARAEPGDQRFSSLAHEYLEGWLERHPTEATLLGDHRHDRTLRLVTEASVDQDLAWTRALQGRLNAVPRATLSFEPALERDLLAARLERDRLELEVLRRFETDPTFYLDLVRGSIEPLLQREYASPCERLRSAAARLQQVPEVLRSARVNLRRPPRVRTEATIAGFEGVLRFYREAIPGLTGGCRDAQRQADLAEADTLAVAAVQEFLRFLLEELLPRSDGDPALGRETYRRLLACEEMETAPLDTLLQRAWAALEAHRARMVALADQIAPGRGVREVLDSLGRSHPDETELVRFVALRLDTVRTFLRAHDLVTRSGEENLAVRAMPTAWRDGPPVALEAPGVWDKRGSLATLGVALPPPGASPQEREESLAGFHRQACDLAVMCEGLPGRYQLLLAAQKLPSPLRQAFGCETARQGWAHYCELLAIEEGFGGGDPGYELAQLSRALREIGRFIADVSFHGGLSTQEELTRLLEDRCYVTGAEAEREARRIVLEPGGAVSTLGKWRIIELREEVRTRLGARFRLREFHDALLAQGGSPFPLAREGVLKRLGLKAAPAGH